MTSKMVPKLLKDVQTSFQFGIPNAIKLGWDPNRLFDEFKNRFSAHSVFNCTDFNYSFCNRFEIEPQYEGPICYTLTARFSFIAPVYSVHSTKYVASKTRGCVVPETSDRTMSFLTGLIHEFANSKGFSVFTSEMSDIAVEGVALELSEVATLGKCLFEDYE